MQFKDELPLQITPVRLFFLPASQPQTDLYVTVHSVQNVPLDRRKMKIINHHSII